MTLLVNRVFAAVETDPMDSEAWKDASDRTLSFMSLGLQELYKITWKQPQTS